MSTLEDDTPLIPNIPDTPHRRLTGESTTDIWEMATLLADDVPLIPNSEISDTSSRTGENTMDIWEMTSPPLAMADDVPLIPNSKIPYTPHRRRTENTTHIWVLATLPLVLHLTFVLTLLAVLIIYIDDHDFNLHSRYAFSKVTPLQSDITTAISSGIAIYRFFAAMWSVPLLWRCVFILMDKGGISLQQINNLLTWQMHLQPRVKSSQGFGFLVAIILLAAFPSQLSGPILTGSITWSSSHRFAEGQRLTGIFDGRTPNWTTPSFLDYFFDSDTTTTMYTWGKTLAPGFAITAWQAPVESERTMKRVIRNIGHLPINSTLNNVTLPYFAIKNLEWIRDPMKDIPQMVASALTAPAPLNDGSNWNPFNDLRTGTFALIPESWVNVTVPSPYTGIISETRIIVGIYSDYKTDFCHTSPLFGELPANIGFNHSKERGCLIYGRITYEAGAAECTDCRVSSWITVQNDTALKVSPSAETLHAIGMMPMVGAMMGLQNNSLPSTYNNLDRYTTELLIRSYAASWTYIKWWMSDPSYLLSTDVQISIPTSRANVTWWRVWFWLWLNLLFTSSGLLFLFAQRTSRQPLIGNPSLAALLLDTSEVLHKRDRALCDFSALTRDDNGLGYLHFRRDEAHKLVEIVEDSE